MNDHRVLREYSKDVIRRSKEKLELQFEFECDLVDIACYILEYGTTERNRSEYYKHFNLPFSCLYLFKNGGAEIEMKNGEMKKLEKGPIYLLPAEMTLDINYESSLQYYFHLHVCDHFKSTFFNSKTGLLQFEDPELYDSIVANVNNEDKFALLLDLHRAIHRLLKDRLPWLHEHTRNTREFRDIFRYLSETQPALVTISDLADIYKVNADTLSKRFKRTTGVSLKDFLQQHILTEAQSLLLSTPLTAIAISEHLGFATSQYFQRFFRRMTGITPGHFRKMHCDTKKVNAKEHTQYT